MSIESADEIIKDCGFDDPQLIDKVLGGIDFWLSPEGQEILKDIEVSDPQPIKIREASFYSEPAFGPLAMSKAVEDLLFGDE